MYEPIENQDYIEVEAAPKDITIDIEGPRKKLDYVDKDVTGVPNIVAILQEITAFHHDSSDQCRRAGGCQQPRITGDQSFDQREAACMDRSDRA